METSGVAYGHVLKEQILEKSMVALLHLQSRMLIGAQDKPDTQVLHPGVTATLGGQGAGWALRPGG